MRFRLPLSFVLASVVFGACGERTDTAAEAQRAILAQLPGPVADSAALWRRDRFGCDGARRRLAASGLIERLHLVGRRDTDIRAILGPPNSENRSERYVDPASRRNLGAVSNLNYTTAAECDAGRVADQTNAEWLVVVVSAQDSTVIAVETVTP